MGSRPFHHAGELKKAWEEALYEKIDLPGEMPWDLVRRLVGMAEQCYRVGDMDEGDSYLAEAHALNRDQNKIPGKFCSGLCYLLAVRKALREGAQESALKLASEGKQRRTCRATFLALAEAYQAAGSPAAAKLFRQSEDCQDKE
jgi:hypothetical protein